MPGEPGNAVIAGSRLAGGAPFRQLQVLDEGDRIDVTTAVGRFRYEVRSVSRVGAGDPDPVRATGGTSSLTLLTTTPKFLAYDQLVVVADLDGQPVKPRFKPVSAEVGDDGFDTGGGLAPVLVWGAALGAAVFGARWLYRRWPRPVAYLITTPVLLALLILLFESLGGILPAAF
jgi:sortase A